jgi:hypothetical protein
MSRTLDIRAAIITELNKIGVTPSSGWDSGSGAPAVSAGAPPLEAIKATPERQIWVQHIGTEPLLETLGAASMQYRYEYAVWVICPDPAAGEDLVSKLERDVRRAVQNAIGSGGALEVSGLANAGLMEGPFEANGELRRAGVAGGIVRLFAGAITQKGAP